MVRAILEGRKTQTRRVIRFKDEPHEPDSHNVWKCFNGSPSKRTWSHQWQDGDFIIKCPYGIPGGRLWVRETWAWNNPPSGFLYRADPLNDWGGEECQIIWKPSIHMPRRFSRINLEITKVRAERLQEINDADIQAEGTERMRVNREGKISDCWRWSFAALWDSINEKRGFGWKENPWVWVIEFSPLSMHP